MINEDTLAYIMNIPETHRELSESILRDIIRRFLKCDFTVSKTAAYQTEILSLSGELRSRILAEVKKASGKQEEEIKEAFKEAKSEIFNYPDEVLEGAGIDADSFKRMSPEMERIYDAATKKAIKNAHGLTRTTASACQGAFISACDLAHMQVSSGAFSYQEAIKNGILAACRNGTQVIYESGHIGSLDNAMRSNLLTGVNQTAGKLQIMRADEFSVDIMETTAHSGARPDHAWWQGKLVSRSGKNGYLTFSDIGYGEVTGIYGAHCRHNLNMHFPGFSERAYTDEELLALQNETVTYNGEVIPKWQAIQKQRSYERSIKKTRRELLGIDEAKKIIDRGELPKRFKGKTSEEASFLLNQEFEKKAVLLKKKEQKLKDFCSQTGLKYDGFRLQQFAVETENRITGWGKSVSQKAVMANKMVAKLNESGIIKSNDRVRLYDKNKNFLRVIQRPKVRLPNGIMSVITSKTDITDVEVFAGMGAKSELRVKKYLESNYGGSADKWQHIKGHAYVDTTSGPRRANIHWFEEESIGVKETFVKGWSKK